MTREERVRAFALSRVGSPYVYGACGSPCTPSELKQRIRQYPRFEALISGPCPRLQNKAEDCASCPRSGKQLYDCAQLVRAAFQIISVPLPSGASSQWRCGQWAYKGPLEATAFRSLCVLFRADAPGSRYPMAHVGLSLGDGRVVDARGHRDGVLLSAKGDYPWTHYALPRALSPKGLAPIRLGDRGAPVRALQAALRFKGFPLKRYGADGIFGDETLRALTRFQLCYGLPANGVADEETQIALEI